MASELGQPPAAAPTTITSIGDDLLREIFLLLPSLPSLVRAALACRTFLDAVRSSPAFRRRFRALHPPQLLGFFSDPGRVAIPPFFPIRSSSDPDLAAAVRGSDFLLIRLPEDSDSAPGWELQSCHGGYLVLVNHTTEQIAAYNPLTQQLYLIPWPPGVTLLHPSLEFYIVFSEEDQGVFRMVCIQHEMARLQLPECIAVFSAATREWQILLLAPENGEDIRMVCPGKQLNGFVYWKTKSHDSVFILDTTTLQFERVDLPPLLRAVDPALLSLGQTNDGELCMVCIDDPFADAGTLEVWFRRTDDDGVEKWMRRDTFLLSTLIDAIKCSIQYYTMVQIEAFIDGFVYLSFKTGMHTESLLLFCLETAKPKKIVEDIYTSLAHPYTMAWPPSLVWSRRARGLKIPEDSQTKVAGESVVDAGPVGTKETHSLASASQSCKFD